MNDLFQNLKNIIDFNLRQLLKISRKNYCEQNELKDGLFTDVKIIEREKELSQKYELDFLKNNSTRENYLENLYTIDLLDRYLPLEFKDELSVLDIGCKNWFYAKGEYFFFKKYCKNLKMEGIELDPHRLYSNMYSRGEVAKYHLTGLENTNYIEDDFLNHNKKYDYLVWILPFVFEYPHQKWGLPSKYFEPQKMLLHSYNSLRSQPNCGKIFVINQGEAEFEAQKALCEKLNLPYHSIGKVQSDFLNYKYPRYLILVG